MVNVLLGSKEIFYQYFDSFIKISFRPSGSIIATSQNKSDVCQVILYERNGLRHGEFALPFSASACEVRFGSLSKGLECNMYFYFMIGARVRLESRIYDFGGMVEVHGRESDIL